MSRNPDGRKRRTPKSFAETRKDENKYFLSVFSRETRRIYVYALQDYETLENSYLLLEPKIFVPQGEADYRCELVRDFLSFLKDGAEICDRTRGLEGYRGRSKRAEISESEFVKYLESSADPDDVLMISKERPESLVGRIQLEELDRGLYIGIGLHNLGERYKEASRKRGIPVF